jgi:hypothetical protein
VEPKQRIAWDQPPAVDLPLLEDFPDHGLLMIRAVTVVVSGEQSPDADLTERISEDSVVPKMVDLGVAHPQTFVLVFTVRKDAEGRDAFGDKLGVPRTLNSGPEKVYRDKRDGVVRGHGATDPHCLPGPVLRAAAAKYLPEYEVEYFTYKGSCPPRSETTSGRMRSGSTMACLMGRLR